MPLSFGYILHSIIALERDIEKESTVEYVQLFLLLGFYTILVKLYTEEVLWGFLPCGFLEENLYVLLCWFICLSFIDPLLMVMTLLC